MPSTIETVLLGILVLLLLFWFRPGLRATMERSRHAQHHWIDVLLPIAAVIAFVLLLIVIT